jgi:hypothetical protein
MLVERAVVGPGLEEADTPILVLTETGCEDTAGGAAADDAHVEPHRRRIRLASESVALFAGAAASTTVR